MNSLEVVSTGPLALVQDLGRPGLAHLGVGASGAADRGALQRANQLLGNPAGAAAVEVLFGGLAVRTEHPVTLAIAGAPAPVEVDGTPVGYPAIVTLAAGQELRLGTPATGARSYLAVPGGVMVEPVLGSRSSDTLSRIGPAPLGVGQLLPIGPPPGPGSTPPPLPTQSGPIDAEPVLRVVPGPRHHWIAEVGRLFFSTWQVSAQSDRVGLRLSGPPLERYHSHRSSELVSEGAVRGAIQIPPSGQPVLFGPDHPLTGGYPIAAVVVAADSDQIGQLVPGQRLRFRLTAPAWSPTVRAR